MLNNRWIILIAGCFIQTILGGVYAWSTFVPYLHKEYELSMGLCGVIFGTTILTFTTTMIFAGRVLLKKGARFTASISAVLFMLGYLVASFSGGSFGLLLLGLGGIVGCGIGFGYVCPLSVGMKWFPESKGFVTGVAVAGFGAGAILLSSVAEYFLLHGTDVLSFFRAFGIVAGITLFGGACLLREPPAVKGCATVTGNRSLIFSWPFYVNVIGIFAGTFAGLLLIGNLTPIVMNMGFSEQQAAVAVSVFAVGNGLGRVVWGKLFDHVHYKSIPLSLLAFALAAGVLLLSPTSWGLMLTVCLIGFCFGANFVLYASAISRFFSTAHFPYLYPICFLAYGIAGIMGPGMGGFIAERTGSFRLPIYLCVAIVSMASLLTYLKLSVFQQQTPKKGVKNNE